MTKKNAGAYYVFSHSLNTMSDFTFWVRLSQFAEPKLCLVQS